MAELLGVVSAGFGIASFALQISGKIQALRSIRNGEASEDLHMLSERLEVLQNVLSSLKSFEELPTIGLIIQHSQHEYNRIERGLEKLLERFPHNVRDPKYRLKRLRLVLSPQIQPDIQHIGDAINQVVIQLNLCLQLCQISKSELQSSEDKYPSRVSDCSQEVPDDNSTKSSNSTQESQKSQAHSISCETLSRNARYHICGARQCACSCHLTRMVSKKYWSLEYTPLSIFLSKPATTRCDSSRLKFQLRLALSRYGIPKAVTLGLDLTSMTGGFSLQPALQVQTIVNYTSPGFEALWRCRRDLISLDEARTKLVEMYRSDPTFKHHRDPSGKSYIQQLLYFGPWISQSDQFSLLRLFCHEFGMSLENEDQYFLIHCAEWIGEGRHLLLLRDILEYGFDPTMIHAPQFEQWPTSSSPDWLRERSTPDPFFVEYIAYLVQNGPGFAGSTPLHNAILAGSADSVNNCLARSQPVEQDVNFLGQTPLHLAATRPAVFHLVLDNSQTLDVSDNWGTTPLMYAAAMGYVEATSLLIERGANPCLRDTKLKSIRRTFIDYALTFGHWRLVDKALDVIKITYDEDIYQVFIRHTVWSILSSTEIEYPDEREMLFGHLISLCKDTDFNISDANRGVHNNNLMHYVGNLDMAQALQVSGFTRWNQPNSKGNLAIDSLCERQDPLLIKFCLTSGTNINHANKEKRTVLFNIIPKLSSVSWHIWDSMDSMLLFLDAGIDVFASDDCKCHCSPRGCDISGVFQVGFSTCFSGSCGIPQPIWTLEWSTLIEEYYGIEASKQVLLSFFRRVKCEVGETCITHVCCHRGQGIKHDDFFYECVPKKLEEEDISEILLEETEFIQNLEDRMRDLSSHCLHDLRRMWIMELKNQYEHHLEDVEEMRERYQRNDSKRVESHKVDYKNDEYWINYSTVDYSPYSSSFSSGMAAYVLWLQHERSRSNTSPFYNLHKPGWYDRRMEWLVELMHVMEIPEETIAHQIEKEQITQSGTGEVDAAAAAASFIASVRKKRSGP